jgi:hypothetical protein
MTLFVPVPSPVASYEATGALAWTARRIASPCQRLYAVLRGIVASVSHASPSPVPQRRRMARGVLYPLLALASACGDADTGYLALLRASIAVLLVLGLLLFLAGVGVGICVALCYLRAADVTMTRHHRATLARVFAASRDLHEAVEDNIRRAHRRIDGLHTQLAGLREAGR